MKTWLRATKPVKCGGQHDSLTLIPKGAPVLVIAPTLTKRFIRCEACAGPAPELPELVAPPTVSDRLPIGMSRPSRTALEAAIPFDYKAAQAGRED
jgi:hypothetical protein